MPFYAGVTRQGTSSFPLVFDSREKAVTHLQEMIRRKAEELTKPYREGVTPPDSSQVTAVAEKKAAELLTKQSVTVFGGMYWISETKEGVK